MHAIQRASGAKFDSNAKRAAQLETFESIQTKVVPGDVLTRYMKRTMATPSDVWFARRNLTTSFASFIFQTCVRDCGAIADPRSYILSVGGRSPARIHISRSSGTMVRLRLACPC